jgi:hypothetical protein
MSLALAASGHSFLADKGKWPIPMMGRLKRGVKDAQAENELDAIFQAYVDAHPGLSGQQSEGSWKSAATPASIRRVQAPG